MRKIAIYGKGGIGKSTTAANLSAALAESGLRVMQIGCDPKADSTRYLAHREVPTVLDVLKENRQPALDHLVHPGYRGILCVEAGGPTPGLGCAGRGIITAFELLDRLQAFATYQPDVVIYDVLGDVVCGGFAMPIRGGYAREVFVVSSGERMSLYAAYNIGQAMEQFKSRGYAKLGGVILNAKGIANELELVEAMAREDLHSQVVHVVPRDPVVQVCEEAGVTVIEGAPDSPMAEVYRQLAQTILERTEDIPEPAAGARPARAGVIGFQSVGSV